MMKMNKVTKVRRRATSYRGPLRLQPSLILSLTAFPKTLFDARYFSTHSSRPLDYERDLSKSLCKWNCLYDHFFVGFAFFSFLRLCFLSLLRTDRSGWTVGEGVFLPHPLLPLILSVIVSAVFRDDIFGMIFMHLSITICFLFLCAANALVT